MLQLVTLLGRKSLAYPWSIPCMRSWRRIAGCADAIHVISDGTLSGNLASLLPGLTVTGAPDEQERIVAERIKKYPSLREMRRRDFTWRKILDASICCGSAKTLVYIDTDVYVRNPVRLNARFENALTYLREDIPAYAGAWHAPLQEPMVLSFNSGLVAFSPDMIDFEFLEEAARRYFLQLTEYWWSEQMAWSLLAGRAVHRFFWNGDEARVVSGCGTRTSEEMSRNIVKFRSHRKYMKSGAELIEYAGNASIIHMAGMGKPHFKALLPGSDTSPRREVGSTSDPTLTIGRSALLAARLAARQRYHTLKQRLACLST